MKRARPSAHKIKEDPVRPSPVTHVLFPGQFSAIEMAEIRAWAMAQPAQAGVIGHGGKAQQHDMRRSSIRWLDVSAAGLVPVIARLNRCLMRANAAHWGRDARGFDSIQFTEYAAWQSGHYDWHRDDNPNGTTPWDRMLTAVTALTPTDQYQGGQFFIHGQESALSLEAGTVVVFPSDMKHCVTPVTAGVRHSLVCWSLGPRSLTPPSP